MRRYMLGLAIVTVVAAGAGIGFMNTGVIAKERPAPEVIVADSVDTASPSDSAPSTTKPTQVVQAQLAQAQAKASTQVAQAAEKNDPLSERVLGDPNAPITILEYSS